MAKLYREHVLKEPAGPGLVQIGSIAAAPMPAVAKPVVAKPVVAKVEEREEVGSFGD